METTDTFIEELTDALIEDKWVLCSPAEAIEAAIGEYLEYAQNGTPYTYNDRVVTFDEFCRAIAGMAIHFENYRNWYEAGEITIKRPRFRRVRGKIASFFIRPLTNDHK